MKILLVQDTDWLERGPHQNHHLMERLSKKDHVIRVIDFKVDWRKKKPRGIISRRMVFENTFKAVQGGKITVVRPSIIELPILEYISFLFTYRREIKRQLKEFKPDIIVGFGILNSYLARRLAKKRGIPFVYYIIDELFRLVPQKYFQNLAKYIESNNIRNADKVLSINEALREYTIQMGAEKKKTIVLPAGIDLERFNPKLYNATIKRKYNLNDEDIVLFFMGWLYNFSGLKEIAMELSKSIEKFHNIKLFIVGKGDLYDELTCIKQEKLGNRMILMDWQHYENIPSLIAASDICILPAYNNEIMRNIVPIKLYEYMAMEKPVIATNLPGIMKEFGENNGVIYVDNPNQVLDKATEIASKGMISNEGKKARKFVVQNDWNTITKDFENILSELI
jgi:glycosyltransferase involved in cell wall biosynthesis